MKKAKDLSLSDCVFILFSDGTVTEFDISTIELSGSIVKLTIGDKKFVFYLDLSHSEKTENDKILYLNKESVISDMIAAQEKRVERLSNELNLAKSYLSELKH